MKTSIGLCGATGKTPELQIGQVKTVDYTQKASVEITGTRENPILNFNIPKGKDGAKLIVREYFNGDIQILNNLNELPQNTNSDSYGKTVMSVNGIKQLLEKINDVLTKANANTNSIGSLTSTVQGNKSDIETKLNNFKSDTDTKVQSINQTISELEQTIETKLNEEITKQVKALQDENKKLNDMIFENSLKERFEGSESSISDTSNGVVKIQTIKGQTIVTDAPTETNPNYKNIESVGDKEDNKISILTHGKNIYNGVFFGNKYVDIDNGGVLNTGENCGTSDFIEVSPQTNYVINNLEAECIGFYDKNKAFISGVRSNNLTTPQNTKFIRCTIKPKELKFQLEEGTQATSYEPYKQDKKEISISLDGGLKSLSSGVADTIEQKEDGFYLVQRIGKTILNGSEAWWWNSIWDEENPKCVHACVTFPLWKIGQRNAISDKFVFSTEDGRDLNKQEIHCHTNSNNVYINLDKSLLSTQDLDGFKQWLQANPTTVYYELATPIETKLDINNLNLKTFKDLTYITSENNIRPVLNGQATKDITTVIKNLQSKGAN